MTLNDSLVLFYVYLSFLPFTLHAFGWREPEWLIVAHRFSDLNEKSNPLLSCVQLLNTLPLLNIIAVHVYC